MIGLYNINDTLYVNDKAIAKLFALPWIKDLEKCCGKNILGRHDLIDKTDGSHLYKLTRLRYRARKWIKEAKNEIEALIENEPFYMLMQVTSKENHRKILSDYQQVLSDTIGLLNRIEDLLDNKGKNAS